MQKKKIIVPNVGVLQPIFTVYYKIGCNSSCTLGLLFTCYCPLRLSYKKCHKTSFKGVVIEFSKMQPKR